MVSQHDGDGMKKELSVFNIAPAPRLTVIMLIFNPKM